MRTDTALLEHIFGCTTSRAPSRATSRATSTTYSRNNIGRSDETCAALRTLGTVFTMDERVLLVPGIIRLLHVYGTFDAPFRVDALDVP